MPLLDALNEHCPARRPPIADFFASMPGLYDEVVEARQAGYTWPQIADAVRREYGYQPHPRTLRDFMVRSR